jgi:hypothetical protein
MLVKSDPTCFNGAAGVRPTPGFNKMSHMELK